MAGPCATRSALTVHRNVNFTGHSLVPRHSCFVVLLFFSLFEMEKDNTPHSWLTGPHKSSPAGDSAECVPFFLPLRGLGGFLMGIKPSLLWLCFSSQPRETRQASYPAHQHGDGVPWSRQLGTGAPTVELVLPLPLDSVSWKPWVLGSGGFGGFLPGWPTGHCQGTVSHLLSPVEGPWCGVCVCGGGLLCRASCCWPASSFPRLQEPFWSESLVGSVASRCPTWLCPGHCETPRPSSQPSLLSHYLGLLSPGWPTGSGCFSSFPFMVLWWLRAPCPL